MEHDMSGTKGIRSNKERVFTTVIKETSRLSSKKEPLIVIPY